MFGGVRREKFYAKKHEVWLCARACIYKTEREKKRKGEIGQRKLSDSLT